MDRRERRRKKRLEARLRKGITVTEPSKASAPSIVLKESPSWGRRGLQTFRKTVSGTKALWGVIAAVLALIGYYASFHPNVSVDPDRLLNPSDPFSTLFSVKNDSSIFDVRNLHPACYTIHVLTDHNFGMNGLGPRPAPTIPVIESMQKTTIDCPPWVSGFGGGAGNILSAFIEIDVSYRQDWWPAATTQRFPFRGVIDSQKAVYWTHMTPSELQALLR